MLQFILFILGYLWALRFQGLVQGCPHALQVDRAAARAAAPRSFLCFSQHKPSDVAQREKREVTLGILKIFRLQTPPAISHSKRLATAFFVFFVGFRQARSHLDQNHRALELEEGREGEASPARD